MSPQRDRWTLSSLWREAIKNVFSPASRLVFVLGLALAAGVFSSLISAWQWNALSQLLSADASKGRNVVVFQGSDVAVPTKIDRATCESLSGEAGVLRAGGMTQRPSETFPQLGPAVQVFSVSTTLLPRLGQVDALVGNQLDYVGSNRRLLLPGGSVAVVSQDSREPDGLNLGTSVAVPFLPNETTTDQCVVVLSQFANLDEAVPRLSSSLVAQGGMLSSSEPYVDHGQPLTDYLNRVERFLPVFLGVLCGFAGLVANRFRSSDIAIYRFSGTSPRSTFLLLFFEQALLAGVFVGSGSLAVVALHRFFVEPSAQVLWACAGGFAWLTLSNFNLAFSRGDPSTLSKDR